VNRSWHRARADATANPPDNISVKKILSSTNRFITRKMLLIQADEVSARFARI
jgi:hypothetical protein